uniref:RNA-directed DNA polymerase, eukaryota, reverse transcriptase zinc-binding domain protein n=1 Tax=Strongyloides papillosus TaxID=174720 RepID=A0A0N5C3J7_STREA
MLRLPCTRIDVKASELDSLIKDLDSYRDKCDNRNAGKRYSNIGTTSPDIKKLLDGKIDPTKESPSSNHETKGPLTRSRKHALESDKDL